MNNYEKMKNQHALRRDIFLVIVLLLLILVAIIFPRFKEFREPVQETEIIYIEQEKGPERGFPVIGTPGPKSLLQPMHERSIPPDIIPDSLDLEWPMLDTFDILLNEALEEISPKAPSFPFGISINLKHLNPEEIWEIYYKEIVKRDPNAEPELGFNLSGYGGPYLKWGCQDYDTPPSLRDGLLTFYSGNLAYPIDMLKAGIEDTVKVVIFVEANGSLSLVRLLEPARHKDFELPAIIAVAKSKWTAGQKDGKAVPVAYIYPVVFDLHNSTLVTSTIYDELMKRHAGLLFDPPISYPGPVNGYEAIKDHLVYPKTEHDAGIEEIVCVNVFVEIDSTVSKTSIIKSSGYDALDSSAINAVKDLKFIPYELDDVKIGLWTPTWVRFKLDK